MLNQTDKLTVVDLDDATDLRKSKIILVREKDLFFKEGKVSETNSKKQIPRMKMLQFFSLNQNLIYHLGGIFAGYELDGHFVWIFFR